MIIHYNRGKSTMVYVVNSRLPVYRAYYGDGFSNTIAGLFTRMAPKVAPLAKQLGMKAIDVIRDKGINDVGNLAGKAFSAAKDKTTSLVRRKKSKNFQQPMVLPSTTVKPAKISKAINRAVEEKLASLATTPLDTQSKTIANMIAGSCLNSNQKKFEEFPFKEFHRYC